MIRIRNLNKTYYGGSPLHVLKGINMDVEKNEFLSIMGASGSGKSTLLNILGILDSYETGEYYLDDVLIRNLSERRAAQLRNQKIGFIFQSFNLISFKNAMENVALPLYYQGVSRKKRNILAMEYLDKMGLKSHADHLPNELSGGQKQRVAIARALIAQPKIILADEPTGALDSKTSEEVMRILRELNTVDGVAMIIVTHEREVAQATDRIIHIKDGIISDNEDVKARREAVNSNKEEDVISVRLENRKVEIEVANENLEEEVVLVDNTGALDDYSPVIEKNEGIKGIELIEEELRIEEKYTAPVNNIEKTSDRELGASDIISVVKLEEPVEVLKAPLRAVADDIEDLPAEEVVPEISVAEKEYSGGGVDTTDESFPAEVVPEERASGISSDSDEKEENDQRKRDKGTNRGYDPGRKWQYI